MQQNWEQSSIDMMRDSLGVVLIGPNEERRRALARAFEEHHATIAGELGGYPSTSQLSKLIELDCDVVVVDLDEDPETALDLVESVCTLSSRITVMVYSRRRDPDLLVKCMRAGAREFLTGAITAASLAEAVIDASARRLELKAQRKLAGKVLLFWGAKGGSGVTTLASNFAVALKVESGRDVALLDLHADLGGVAVVLGLNPRFTVSDALRNPERLDQELVSSLLTEHRSGVQVLAAPDECEPAPTVDATSVGKLLFMLRSRFHYVVVDAGPTLGSAANAVFEAADTVYLVTQGDIPSLRNAQRWIAHLQRWGGPQRKLEVVFNRYEPRRLEIDEGRIAKALGLPLKWKVPNDFNNVYRSLNTGDSLAATRSPVSKALCQMAREACGKAPQTDQRKWGLFG